MNNFISGYQQGQEVKERRNMLAKREQFNQLAGGLGTATDRAPVIGQMMAIDAQAAAPIANYFAQNDRRSAEEAQAKAQEAAKLSLNKALVVRSAPRGRKVQLWQQLAPEHYQQSIADGTPPTDEEIDMAIDSGLPELYSKAGVPFQAPQNTEPKRDIRSVDGALVDVTDPTNPNKIYQGQGTDRPQAPPTGYRYTKDGQLEFIPGGPADPAGPGARKQNASLRKEFRSLPSVKEYETVLPLIASAKKAPDTGYGDLQLIYTVGKTLDPGSVVREGELALTIQAGSPLQRLLGTTRFNFEKGGRLTPQQRNQIIEMLNQRVGAAKQAYERDFNQYSQYASDMQINPVEIVGSRADSAFEPKPQQGGVKFLGFE